MILRVPVGLVETTARREGDAGRMWLQELPRMVDAACRRWHCHVDGEPTHGQVALVVPVRHLAGPAVMKLSFPHSGNLGEADALRTFAGHGAIELLETDDAGLVLVLERARSQTLADHVVNNDCPVEEAIEVAGDLARRLAVDPLPAITPLAHTTEAWREEMHAQFAAQPYALPGRALDRASETIEHLAADGTSTMLHGDLHFGNILSSHREPWLTIDPKGWSGSAAFDAFTVIAGGRQQLDLGEGPYEEFVRRVGRFAAAAQVDPDLALACCQARAVSSYLHQLQFPGTWFDLEYLKVIVLVGKT